MNERDVMSILNSMDEDLLDAKIDELLAEKGEGVDMEGIKEKAMHKLNERESKKKRVGKRLMLGVAVAASLAFTTVYADEISSVLKSFFNKSAVYSTVVDGSAYYLAEEVELNDRLTLTHVSVSKDRLDMTIRANGKLEDGELDHLDISVVPRQNTEMVYKVGGLGSWGDNQYSFSFYNEKEKNYHIEPFDAFELTLGGEGYSIMLTEAEAVKVDEMSIGVSEAKEPEEVPSVAHMAGSIIEEDGKRRIRLIAGFEDADLKLSALGVSRSAEYKHSFENDGEGVVSVGSGPLTNAIMAYDSAGKGYTLSVPEDASSYPITVFDIGTEAETPLTVKLPAIGAHYEKEVASMTLAIPSEGETTSSQTLDFIIQQGVVKSVKRVSEDTAVVELDLNTGGDKSVCITDIGAYSRDVVKAETVVKGNTAVITMTIDPNLEEAAFRFSYPYFEIRGDWSIMLEE